MITVLTWLWSQKNGRAKYTADHVHIWASMLRRNLTIPHRIACVTDLPLEGIDVIPLPDTFAGIKTAKWDERKGLPQCYRRLDMFRPDAAGIYGERFVSMDLDCVITGNIDHLFDRPDDFVMYKGTSGQRPYNGSMVMMDAGARSKVFTEFSQEGAEEASSKYIGSDQAWIAHCLGWGEKTWDTKDGVYWFKRPLFRTRCPEDAKIVFFPGQVKPWDVDAPWIKRHYR